MIVTRSVCAYVSEWKCAFTPSLTRPLANYWGYLRTVCVKTQVQCSCFPIAIHQTLGMETDCRHPSRDQYPAQVLLEEASNHLRARAKGWQPATRAAELRRNRRFPESRNWEYWSPNVVTPSLREVRSNCAEQHQHIRIRQMPRFSWPVTSRRTKRHRAVPLKRVC